MATFFAYFDLLGYKNFIENNTVEWLDKRTNDFALWIESAVAKQKRKESKRAGLLLSDMSESPLQILTFSDTVVLWCKESRLEDFEELLDVCLHYNYLNNLHDFPSRGCIVYGDLWFKPYTEANNKGGHYMLNMIYGKALINAYSKAEKTSWAGCVVDISAIEYAASLGDIAGLLNEYTIVYDVPYDKGEKKHTKREHALRFLRGDVLITEHYEESIRRGFVTDNKGPLAERQVEILNNTIQFLYAHKINFPYTYYFDASTDVLDAKVYGKLQENYTHTIITRRQNLKQENAPITYSVETLQFDPNNSDRGFFKAEKISLEQFNKQKEQINN